MQVNNINQTNFKGGIFIPADITDKQRKLVYKIASKTIDTIQKKPYDLRIESGDIASKLKFSVTSHNAATKGGNVKSFEMPARAVESHSLKVVNKLVKQMDKHLDIKA